MPKRRALFQRQIDHDPKLRLRSRPNTVAKALPSWLSLSAAIRAMIVSKASDLSSVASRPSSTPKFGAIPASSGNRCRTRSQKPWMV